jgi:hypothetical protein
MCQLNPFSRLANGQTLAVVGQAIRRVIGTLLFGLCLLGLAASSQAQSSSPQAFVDTGRNAVAGTLDTTSGVPHWEITLGGQAGFPGGHLQVGETNAPGTSLSLHGDLGVDVSEAMDLATAYHFTARDALRVSFLYFFLEGSSTINHPVEYNGQTFPAGRFHTDADFWRVTLAYERQLLSWGPGTNVIGTAGLTYVYFNPKINGNSEDFYLQELPIPLLGVRLESPLGDRLSLTASLTGGLLPRVDSGRKEGGTVYLQQSHADAALGLTYALTAALRLEASYRLTYFTQHELSHEDNNAFLLLDNGFRLTLTYRF